MKYTIKQRIYDYFDIEIDNKKIFSSLKSFFNPDDDDYIKGLFKLINQKKHKGNLILTAYYWQVQNNQETRGFFENLYCVDYTDFEIFKNFIKQVEKYNK